MAKSRKQIKLVAIILIALAQTIPSSAVENVIVRAELNDGQFSRWISMNGLKFKETSLTPQPGKSPVTLWQFVYKKSFFQIIFNDGLSKMVDCERIRPRGLVDQQSRKFDKELAFLLNKNHSSSNSQQQHHHFYRMPAISEHEFNQYLSSDDEQQLPESYRSAFVDEEEFDDINRINRHDLLNYAKILAVEPISAADELPSEIRPLLEFQSTIAKCEAFHRDMKELVHGLESAEEERRQNATKTLSRRKRAISDLFLAPNTRWCGKGSATSSYLEIGGHSRADKCCRKHDHCKMNIHAMSAKFRLFNYRPFTISHCNCDRRFRTCLKMADSSDANLVGNLFFNVIKTKCFVLKPEKICKQFNYQRMKCEKKGIQKRAHLRDNREF